MQDGPGLPQQRTAPRVIIRLDFSGPLRLLNSRVRNRVNYSFRTDFLEGLSATIQKYLYFVFIVTEATEIHQLCSYHGS